jgi:hypothetical protein
MTLFRNSSEQNICDFDGSSAITRLSHLGESSVPPWCNPHVPAMAIDLAAESS